jgi:cytosine permease
VLIAIAVFAPMLTSVHSGALALRSTARISLSAGMAGIVALGVLLGIARFDRQLLFWLALLAAALPPVILPIAAERWRRRRGRPPLRVPVWAWGVPGTAAVALVVAGHPLATVTGLVLAGLLTALWLPTARR